MLININLCIIYLIYIFIYTNLICIIYFFNYINNYINYNSNINNIINIKYDYIIVGSGTAGSILVHELLNNKQKNSSILLIEAGSTPFSLLDIPMISPLLQSTVYDWKYETEPQKYACWGFEKKVSKWPRGKILGGSSRLNYMIYLRGHEADFESWPSNYNFQDYNQFSVPQTTTLYHFSSFSNTISKSMKQLGYMKTNLNLGKSIGYMQTSVTINDGVRSCCDQYIDLNNQYLTLLTNALVTKILFKHKIVTGVEFDYFGQNYQVFGETVILSAGAIGTPQLLMISGVGPQEHLKSVNISVLIDSPHVGSNLQDHIGVGMDSIILNETFISSYDVINMRHAWEFIYKKQGLWTFNGVEMLALLKTDETLSRPDIQLMFMPAGLSIDNGAGFKKTMGISEKTWSNYFDSKLHNGGNPISVMILLLHPFSVGHIRLQDKSIYSKPIIDPMYLKDKRDVMTLTKGIRFVQKLIKTKEFQSMNATFRLSKLDNCVEFNLNSDDYWECYIRTLTFTIYHPGGTCAIGKVVDENLKVKDLNNLYIADTSVFPMLPSGNTQALSILIAQKLARYFQYKQYLNIGICYRKFIFYAMCCAM